MKTIFFRSATMISLCFLLLMSACQSNDQKISRQITDKVDSVAPHVTVHVENGIATLKGQVRNQAIRSTVDSLTKSVKGVKSIIDSIESLQGLPPVSVSTDQALKHTIDSTLQARDIQGVNVEVSNDTVILTGEVKKKDTQTIMEIAHTAQPEKVINQLSVGNE